MIYWASTKSPSNLFRPDTLTPEREAALRASVGIDAHVLALEFGVGHNVLMSWQRYLGLRPVAGRPARMQLPGGRKRKTKND